MAFYLYLTKIIEYLIFTIPIKLLFKGMDTIETLEPAAFVEYLKTFSNTICGRHPISVLLQVILQKIIINNKLLLNNLMSYF